jgi:hypothetical protein
MRAATAKIKKDVVTVFDYTRWGVWALGILVAIARHSDERTQMRG